MRSRDPEPPFVTLDIPPGAGMVWLRGWGRAPDGRWWAILTWRDYLTDPVTHVGQHPHMFAAWARAEHVHPQPSERPPGRYAGIPRVELEADPGAWPAPPGWDQHDPHYLGVLDGREPAIPAELGTPW